MPAEDIDVNVSGVTETIAVTVTCDDETTDIVVQEVQESVYVVVTVPAPLDNPGEPNRRDYLFFAARSQANGTSTAIAGGTVYEAVFKDEDAAVSTIYRHVSTATNARGYPVEDAFYSAFDGTTLTGLLAVLF